VIETWACAEGLLVLVRLVDVLRVGWWESDFARGGEGGEEGKESCEGCEEDG
jgi:hypothetical protein